MKQKRAKHAIADKQIEEAIRAAGGFLTTAAKAVGLSYTQMKRRMAKSERLREVRDEVCEVHLDIAEDALIKAVKVGEAWAVCFYLKCKGKGRGYIERESGAVPDVTPPAETLPDDELKEIANGDAESQQA